MAFQRLQLFRHHEKSFKSYETLYFITYNLDANKNNVET